MLRILISVLVLVLGGVLAVGGVWLVTLGGAWGYIVLGALLVVSGALMLARRKSGLAVYGVALLFALVWGLAEVGLYWWGLAPRGGLLVLLGLMLLLPPVARTLTKGTTGFRGYGVEGMSLAASVAIMAVVALVSVITQPYDTRGQFSDDRMSAGPFSDGTVPDGEWSSYGRTGEGQRYSPLAQITPANVADLEVAWEYNAGEVHVNLPGTAL